MYTPNPHSLSTLNKNSAVIKETKDSVISGFNNYQTQMSSDGSIEEVLSQMGESPPIPTCVEIADDMFAFLVTNQELTWSRAQFEGNIKIDPLTLKVTITTPVKVERQAISRAFTYVNNKKLKQLKN
jgi:hypothetical protein